MYSKKSKVILTFDVELWHEGKWQQPFIDYISKNDISFEKSMDKILNLLQQRKASATFFVTSLVVDSYPNYIKKIKDAGHEVSSHGIDHQKLHQANPIQYREKLIEHTKRIKEITGSLPQGFRAPHFSLNKKSSWIIQVLKELDYKYDSSIFPISITNQYGHSKAPRENYYVNENIIEKSSDGLLEIPISTSSLFSIRIPYAGGIYFRILPLFIFKYFLKKESRKTTAPIIYFHPHELESSTPKINRGPILKRIVKYWGTKKSFRKFERLFDDFEFQSIEKNLGL
ncbi:polysaccharide deacetylase family protein [Candidatus Nomurabacteria bacterium]|nr:polysaccharide deacetylase family protein [Candidatus Nomurabacteria bacterium]